MKLLAQLIIGLISVLIMAAPAFAAGQSSANFIMKADALNNGVGDMTSANFGFHRWAIASAPARSPA